MSLRDWQENGWLSPHQTSSQEIGDLLALIDRDLADARTPLLSADWRLGIAYNAALQAATAALAACGFRASREAHHFRVIQSLKFTLRIEERVIRELDQFRKKRNISGYERAGAASDQEAREMLQLAGQLRQELLRWLTAEHPGLLHLRT